MDKLNEILRTKAIQLGLCQQWQDDWKDDWSKDEMFSKFFEGIDFCIANSYPSVEFIKKYFTKDELIRHNALVDIDRSILNVREAAVFGSSNVIARYNGRSGGRIYVKDNASLNVIAHNASHVIIHVIGSARVNASCHESARVVIIKHSKDCEINTSGENIEIKEEYGLYDNP